MTRRVLIEGSVPAAKPSAVRAFRLKVTLVARVLEAKRACPPEDVGGSWGYDEFLKVLANPRHKQHLELREWAGGGFDADAFDIEATNRKLAKLRVSVPRR